MSIKDRWIKIWFKKKKTWGVCTHTHTHTHKEGIATHSGILALRIPWTEESGVLQSRGSQESRHD